MPELFMGMLSCCVLHHCGVHCMSHASKGHDSFHVRFSGIDTLDARTDLMHTAVDSSVRACDLSMFQTLRG